MARKPCKTHGRWDCEDCREVARNVVHNQSVTDFCTLVRVYLPTLDGIPTRDDLTYDQRVFVARQSIRAIVDAAHKALSQETPDPDE